MINKVLRQKEYSAKHYAENKERKLKLVKINNEKYKLRNRQYVFNYLKKNPCSCGELDPIVLEFDHNNPLDKIKSVSKLANSPVSLEIVKKEINKCTVRCANCHRRKTAKSYQWYKDLN